MNKASCSFKYLRLKKYFKQCVPENCGFMMLLHFGEIELLTVLTQSNSWYYYGINKFLFFDILVLKSCTMYLPIHNSYTFHHKLLVNSFIFCPCKAFRKAEEFKKNEDVSLEEVLRW